MAQKRFGITESGVTQASRRMKIKTEKENSVKRNMKSRDDIGDVRSERTWLVLQFFNINNRFLHLMNITQVSHP
jgi:hypothetical protein